MSSAADVKQVGGTHYKEGGKFQHWNMVIANGLPYLPAVATKYVTRWRKKNGLEDVEKAGHYLDKMIEVAQAPKPEPIDMIAYGKANGLSRVETTICYALTHWNGDVNVLLEARELLRQLEDEARAAEPSGGYINQG